MVKNIRGGDRPKLHHDSGFTLIELMLAMALMTVVLGGAVAMAMQMQSAYTMQLENATAEEEGRYALDWIARILRSAGSDAKNVVVEEDRIVLDPNGNGVNDDLEIQADVNSDGTIGEGEHITIAYDPDDMVITKQDPLAADPSAVAMTEPIFTDLSFSFLNSSHAATTNPNSIAYVRVSATVRSKSAATVAGVLDEETGVRYLTSTLDTEVRLRTR